MAYNRESAVAYAHKWAFSRNPAYYNFDKVGGDCTNFISQCLLAGGSKMNYTRNTGWYYNSVNDRAPAWSGVEFLYRFLVRNKSIGPYATELPMQYANIGDIIQLNFSGGVFSHTLLVVSTSPEILIATHTYDSDYRPLSTYEYQRARLLHVDGVGGA